MVLAGDNSELAGLRNRAGQPPIVDPFYSRVRSNREHTAHAPSHPDGAQPESIVLGLRFATEHRRVHPGAVEVGMFVHRRAADAE